MPFEGYLPVHETFPRKIVEVHWPSDVYRLTAYSIVKTPGGGYTIQFIAGKAFYTSKELDELARTGQKLPPPVFGGPTGTPTETRSPNGTYVTYNSFGFPYTFILTGNFMYSTRPSGGPDYRGYLDLQCFDVGTIGGAGGSGSPTFYPVLGSKIKFDYNGKTIGSIPADKKTIRERGLPIASDEDGTVYVLLYPEDNFSRLTKYDGDKLIWRVDFTGSPDTVNFNSKTKIIAVTYISLPSGFAGVEYYTMDGVRAGGFELPEEFSCNEVSRKGVFYGMTPRADTHFEGLKAYNAKGGLMWNIPGEDNNGWAPGALMAYGEDYLIVGFFKNTGELDSGSDDENDILWSTSGRYFIYRVYDARTGAQIREGAFPSDIMKTTKTDKLNMSTVDYDVQSWGHFPIFVRSNYWP